MKIREIYNLQIIRGIAALLVVFEHLLPEKISKFVPQGQIGVSMFFFISGFVMVYSFKEKESGLLFLFKRIDRIYPAYLILSLPLIVCFSWDTGSLVYLIHSISLIAYSSWIPYSSEYNFVQRATSSPVAWTLYYEMFFYFVFSISKLISLKRGSVVFLTSLIIISILFLFNFRYGNNGLLGWSNVSYIHILSNLSLLSFVAGMIFPFIGLNENLKKIPLWVFLIPVLSWFMIKFSGKYMSDCFHNQQVNDLLFSSIPSWIFVSILINGEKINGFVAKKLHFIGMISFSLYLFHANFYVLKLHLSLSDMPMMYQLFYFFLSFLISLYVAYFSFKYIESIRPLRSVFLQEKK